MEKAFFAYAACKTAMESAWERRSFSASLSIAWGKMAALAAIPINLRCYILAFLHTEGENRSSKPDKKDRTTRFFHGFHRAWKKRYEYGKESGKGASGFSP